MLLPDDVWGSDDKVNSAHLVSYMIFSDQVLLLSGVSFLLTHLLLHMYFFIQTSEIKIASYKNLT